MIPAIRFRTLRLLALLAAFASAAPWAAEVQIAAPSVNLPPYFIASNHTGMEQEVIAAAFRQAGMEPRFRYIRRRESQLSQPDSGVECVTTVTERQAEKLGGGHRGGKGPLPVYFSAPVIEYQDVIFYIRKARRPNGPLKERRIETLEDLRQPGLRIEAFEGAADLLGLGNLADSGVLYREHSSKASQLLLIYRGKVDAMIAEKRLLAYYRKFMQVPIREALEGYEEFEEGVATPFQPVQYRIACRSQATVAAFDQGLKALQASGELRKIHDRYPQLSTR